MLQPLLIAEAFGVREYARIFSVSNLMSSWGTAIGPALLGFAFTASNNLYGTPYAIAAGAGTVGLVLFLLGGKILKAAHPDSDRALL
jgi:MFS family permease